MVILSDRPRAVKRLLSRAEKPIRFLRLSSSAESHRIARELRAMQGAQEVSKVALCREHWRDFRRAYIELLAQLNEEHQGLAWQLMPFTTKNPLSTDLCRNTFYALLIAKLMKESSQPLLIITDSVALASQVASWGAQVGVRVVRAVQGGSRIKRALKYYLPGAVVAAWIKAGIASVLARSLRPNKYDRKPCVVVTSTIPQSFIGPEGYREAYFAPLAEYLVHSGQRAITFAMLFADSVGSIRSLRRLIPPLPVVPVEACLTAGDLLECGWRSLIQWTVRPRLRVPAQIQGLDVRPLIHQAMYDSYRSSSFLKHLCVYLGARRLALSVPVSHWFYPFENRALEKALLLGVRHVSPQTKLIGCQNAALTPSHLNFMFGERESAVTPLPDVLFTTGPVVKEWLIREGNFPPALIKVGCALRQNGNGEGTPRTKPTRVRRVVVVLASSLDEYVEVLAFLAEAFIRTDDYEIRIRPHPEFNLESADRLIQETTRMWYHVSSGSLAADLAWTDVVLYASSTVGMEAVAMGIPAIYLDLGQVMNADPLANRPDGLSWKVGSQSELLTRLQRIEVMSEDEFVQRHRSDCGYVGQYLVPPTTQRIQALMEAP